MWIPFDRLPYYRGTQFRIWAARTLRDHLVQGYTLNERRLQDRGLAEIGHFGTGDLEITLKSEADFEKAKPVLVESYEAG